MNKGVVTVNHEQWRRTVYECIHCDSKRSKRQWCEENGIRYRSFLYWQKKFQKEAISQIEKQKDELSVGADSAVVPKFVDLTSHLRALQSDQASIPGEAEHAGLAPEVMIQAGSYRIYVSGSVHADTLETVMKVIGHA